MRLLQSFTQSCLVFWCTICDQIPDRFINEPLKNTVVTCRSYAAICCCLLYQSIKGANPTAMPWPWLWYWFEWESSTVWTLDVIVEHPEECHKWVLVIFSHSYDFVDETNVSIEMEQGRVKALGHVGSLTTCWSEVHYLICWTSNAWNLRCN